MLSQSIIAHIRLVVTFARPSPSCHPLCPVRSRLVRSLWATAFSPTDRLTAWSVFGPMLVVKRATELLEM